jgi:hypothetical protein
MPSIKVSFLRHLRIATIAFVPFLALSASAKIQLKSESESGSNYFSQTVSISQSFEKKKGLHLSRWKLSAGQSKSTATTAGSTDLTTSNFGGYLYPKTDAFDFTTGLKSSSTKETSYRSQYLVLGASYEWFYIKKPRHTPQAPTTANEDTDDTEIPQHDPSIVFGITTNIGNIQQDLNQSGVRRRRNEVYSLGSNSAGIDLTWNWLEWMSLSAGVTTYMYSQSADDIRAVANNSTLLERQANLQNTLYGLAKSGNSFGLDFYIGEAWDLNLSYATSTALVDDSISTTTEAILGYLFESGLKINVGTSSSGYSGQTATTDYLFNIGYRF